MTTRFRKRALFALAAAGLATIVLRPGRAQDDGGGMTGTDVFSVETSGGDDTGDPGPFDDGFFVPIPGPDPTTGGLGTPGTPQGGGPGILNGPLLRAGINNNRPCGGRVYEVTAREYFETQVQNMQCAADGVSPGVHRMCADIAPEVAAGKCMDPGSIPKIPANIQRLVFKCRTGVDPVTKQADRSCLNLVRQQQCADLQRLQTEITATPVLPATLSNPQNRQINSPYWPRSVYVMGLSARLQACPESAKTPPPPAPEPPCSDAAPAAMQSRLASIAQQMDAIKNEAGNSGMEAIEQFYRGMADMVGTNARFLAQKPGEPAQQISEAVLNYMTADHNANDAQLRQAAVDAVRQFRQNPAYFLGQNVLSVIPAAGCAAKATSRLKLFNRVTAAAKRLQKFSEAEDEFAKGTGSAPWCSGGDQKAYNPGGAFEINPFAEQKNCVPASIAGAQKSLTGKPLTADDIRPVWQDKASSRQEVMDLLRKNFGHIDITDLDEDRMALQREGDLLKVAGRSQIESELSQNGRGALILTTDGAGNSHMFRAENIGGTVRYFDDQQGFNRITNMDAAVRNFMNVKSVFVFRYR